MNIHCCYWAHDANIIINNNVIRAEIVSQRKKNTLTHMNVPTIQRIKHELTSPTNRRKGQRNKLKNH